MNKLLNKVNVELHQIKGLTIFIAIAWLTACGAKTSSRIDGQSTVDFKDLDPRLLSENMVVQLDAKASKGDAQSAWMLHSYYAHKHDAKAASYLVRAAELGDPAAQCSYYFILMESPDPKTREHSVNWLKKAVSQGYQPATEYLRGHDDLMKMNSRANQ